MPSAAGSTKHVRRWIVWVTVLLLAGALINVAVAWGFARWPPSFKGVISSNGGTAVWPAPVPADWPSPVPFYLLEGRGFRSQAASAHLAGGSGGAVEHFYWVTASRSGWPFPSMGWTHWQHTTGGLSADITTGLVPQTSWWHWGIPIPKWMCAQVPYWQRLPVRPVPLPFLANSLFYAAALGAPVLGVAWVGKRLRKKPGHCGRCGYDLRDLPAGAPCPECGAARSHEGAAINLPDAPPPAP